MGRYLQHKREKHQRNEAVNEGEDSWVAEGRKEVGNHLIGNFQYES